MGSQRRVGRLLVHEYGDPGGPVLLLLHGLVDSGQCFPDLVTRLGSTYRIVAPDALAHGGSDRFTAEELASADPIEAMYDATGAVLEDIGPALVLGHSMGGAMAAALASRRPDLVRAVVMEDPAWLDESPWGDDEAVSRQSLALTRFATADPDGAIAQCRAENPTWPESEFGPWAQAKAEVDETFLRSGVAVLRTPWRDIATAIETPAMVVTGDREVLLDDALLAEVGRLNPRFDVRVVEGAAHCVRRDRGDAFHAIVDPWLAAHAG
jgi:pimeloyl-ACP methyl ester carboxylesterase